MAEAASRRPLATLWARFGGVALSVAPPGQADQAVHRPTAAQAAQWAPLQAWCFLGAGDGSSPLFQPARAPRSRSFEPCRATLVVAVDWPEQALVHAITAMARSSPRFLHPVRWLVVQGAGGDVAERLASTGLPWLRLQAPAAAR